MAVGEVVLDADVIELGAAGGILALLFQDIAPLAHPWPTIGAISGLLLGLAGRLWL